MTMQKKYIEDKDGNKVLPITHQSAVKDDNGTTLDTVIANIENAATAEASRASAAESALSSGKADKATTLAGYGITDAYTKSETYTKTEVNNLITTPSQEYVSVTATSQTTSATDVLPATGAADTVYRVGNWNGTQYSEVDYAEYAWNGSTYIKLSTKSQIGEVYDISANHADTKYVDLTAALGVNGVNIPESLRKGGMSVKFVQSSDNKYVRYNLLAQSFTTDAAQWAIDDAGVYVDNPEFIEAKTDKDGKLLEARKTNGTKVEYGNLEVKGEFINKELQSKLNAKANAVDVATGLANKVDKKQGKSLINAAVASSQDVIDNQEWLDATTDINGVLIEGIKKDGTKVIYGNVEYPNGIPEGIKEYVNDQIEDLHIDTCFSGKTAVWIGTSIPTMGYPQLVGTALNMTVHNEAIGSSMCRTGRTTRGDAFGDDIGCSDVPWQSMLLSLSMTQTEKNRMFKRWTTEARKQLMISEDGYTAEQVANVVGYGTLMGGNFVGEDTVPTSIFPDHKPIDIMSDVYIELRKFCYKSCWDNSLNIESGFGEIKGVVEKYLNENDFPDYWFFDHGHNDGLYQDIGTIETIPSDVYDRSYLIGSFNFICKKILEYNKDAKIIFVGHYTNKEGASNNADKVCNAQEKVSNLWQYDILKCWEFLPFSLMLITTNGYWDANHVWHDSGYDGTNHVGHDQNKRQIDGVWYHDLTMKQMWMWDDLHPWGAAKIVYANGIIYNLIKK